jgi:hypothetical protein
MSRDIPAPPLGPFTMSRDMRPRCPETRHHRHRHFGPDRLPFQAASIRLIPFGSVPVRLGCGHGRDQGFSRAGESIESDRSSGNETDSDGLRRIEMDVGSSSRWTVPTLCPHDFTWVSCPRQVWWPRLEHPDSGNSDWPWASATGRGAGPGRVDSCLEYSRNHSGGSDVVVWSPCSR